MPPDARGSRSSTIYTAFTWSVNDATPAVQSTTSINGKPVTPIQDTLGLRVGLGATVYF